MSKVIPIMPIRTHPVPSLQAKFVELQLHNVCNYSCSFCGPRHRGGDKRWGSLEESKIIIDKIVNACAGKPFWIQLTGGEPTLMPDLIELIQYIKDKGGYTSIISNGSRTIRWWTEIRDRKLLDLLFITYHPEQTSDIDHIRDVIQLFHYEPVTTLCLITHVSGNVQTAFDAFEYLKENTGASVTVKAMMIQEYDIYQTYTDEELMRLKELNWIQGRLWDTKVKSTVPESHKHKANMMEIYADGSVKIRESQEIFKDNTNVYTGWKCDIGRSTMRIDVDKIYRGVCSVGGVVGNVSDENYKFTNDYVICDLPFCFCGTDMLSNKYKIDKG